MRVDELNYLVVLRTVDWGWVMVAVAVEHFVAVEGSRGGSALRSPFSIWGRGQYYFAKFVSTYGGLNEID